MSNINSINGASGSLSQSSGSSGSSGTPTTSDLRSWYEAMAGAWGTALDSQATKIADLSDQVSNGGQDQPSTMTKLTAESLRMQFMSNSASTATSSVGQALETLARKQ